jgi:hypothetical protein
MAAPTNTALVKKVLANSEPSTHGAVRTRGEAEVAGGRVRCLGRK